MLLSNAEGFTSLHRAGNALYYTAIYVNYFETNPPVADRAMFSIIQGINSLNRKCTVKGIM